MIKPSLFSAISVLFGLCAVSGPIPASAQSFGGADMVSVDVIPGWREADGRHYAGVRIRLAPGWKTYWRTPGDGGIPPQFNLEGSDNLAAFEPRMPRPTVFDEDGLRSIGYKTEVVFPLELQAETPGAPITLDGSLFIGVCEEVCVPAEVLLQGVLRADGQSSALIATALAAQPEPLLGQMECSFAATPDGLSIRATLDAPEHGDEIAVIEVNDPTLWVSHATNWREGGRLVAEAQIIAASDGPIPVARSGVRVTVLSNGAAYENLGCAPG